MKVLHFQEYLFNFMWYKSKLRLPSKPGKRDGCIAFKHVEEVDFFDLAKPLGDPMKSVDNLTTTVTHANCGLARTN